MLATISGIQEDEVKDVVAHVEGCNGTVTSRWIVTENNTISLRISADDEDQAGMDVAICDLGFEIIWN